MRILYRLLYVIAIASLLFAAWLMLQITLPYILGHGDRDFLNTKEMVRHIFHWKVAFYIHVATSIFVLVAGIPQFSRYVIHKQKTFHRICGYTYVLIVLFITGPSAFIIGLYANGGIPARISFVTLSILWIATTAIALRKAIKLRFIEHGSWMLRSYALTLSAITLRTYAFLFGYLHIQMRPVHIYITIAWLSWIPNLIIAEIMIRRGFIKWLLRKSCPTVHNTEQL